MPTDSVFDEIRAGRFGGGSSPTAPTSTDTAPLAAPKLVAPKQDDVFDEMRNMGRGTVPAVPKDTVVAPPSPETVAPPSAVKQFGKDLLAGVDRGVTDIADTGAGAIATVDRLFIKGGEERSKLFLERAAREKEKYDKIFGGNIPAEVGRFGGEAIATAPLISGKVMQGIKSFTGALPVEIAGETKAAPFVNRLAGSVGTGAYGGGVFGASTSSVDPNKSVLYNTLENAVLGGVGGPGVMAAETIAKKATPIVMNMFGNYKINKIANEAGIAPNVARNVLERMAEAGVTVDDAMTALAKNPKLTLLDLSETLASHGRGLAQKGGVPMTILKGRMNERAEDADNAAARIVQEKLGAPVNIEDAKQEIVNRARGLTRGDYKAAYASTDPIDPSGAIKVIDDRLKNAVGGEASILKEIKSYFFREDKGGFNTRGYAGSKEQAIDKLSAFKEPPPDIKAALDLLKSGKDIPGVTGKEGQKVLKTDIEGLHAVRQGLDDLLDKLPTVGSTAKTNTYRNVSRIRNSLDEALKTNPAMQAADTKFAEHMKIKDALQTGHDALSGGSKGFTRDEFASLWAGATDAQKEQLKKGMQTHIYEVLDKGSQGELTQFNRLFGKNARNRDMLKTAFGDDAVNALDDLSTQIRMRNTERTIKHGSDTAHNLKVGELYGNKAIPIGDTALGVAFDVGMGSSGGATAVMAGKQLGNRLRVNIGQRKADILAGQTADILSRGGGERDAAVSVLKRVQAIQERLPTTDYREGLIDLPRFSLPVVFGKEFRKNTEKAIDYYGKNK